MQTITNFNMNKDSIQSNKIEVDQNEVKEEDQYDLKTLLKNRIMKNLTNVKLKKDNIQPNEIEIDQNDSNNIVNNVNYSQSNMI